MASYRLPGPDAAQYVTALFAGRDGAIWCGTRDGLFRKLPGGTFQAVEIGLPSSNWKARYIQALAMDREDGLFGWARRMAYTGAHAPVRWNVAVLRQE